MRYGSKRRKIGSRFESENPIEYVKNVVGRAKYCIVLSELIADADAEIMHTVTMVIITKQLHQKTIDYNRSIPSLNNSRRQNACVDGIEHDHPDY